VVSLQPGVAPQDEGTRSFSASGVLVPSGEDRQPLVAPIGHDRHSAPLEQEEGPKRLPFPAVVEPDIADKIRGGKVQAAGAVVGAVMKATGGKADAKRVRELVVERCS
jgi:hypothetical protein